MDIQSNLKSEPVDHENSNAVVSSSTPSTSECLYCSVVLTKVEKLNTELQSFRRKIIAVTDAVERLAVNNSNALLKFAIQDFKQIAEKKEASSSTFIKSSEDSNTCQCFNSQNLRQQKHALVSALEALKTEVVERTAAVEELAEDDDDKLLTVFISKVKKLAPSTKYKLPSNNAECSKPKKAKLDYGDSEQNDVPSTSTAVCSYTTPCTSAAAAATFTQTEDSTSVVPTHLMMPVIKVEPTDNVEAVNENSMPIGHEYNAISWGHCVTSLPMGYMIHPNQLPQYGLLSQSHVVRPPSVEEVAFAEPKILQAIIEAMDFMEWKIARLVSSAWNSIATKLLLDRDCCSVLIRFDVKKNLFRQSSWLDWNCGTSRSREIQRDKPLSELNKILEKSNNFPSTSFAFAFGDLGSPDANKFFEIQGTQIKQLLLKGDVKATSRTTLKNILEVHAPNIKYLEIRNLEYPWKNREFLYLPNLDFICFSNCDKTAAAIFRGSATNANLDLEVADPIGDYKKCKLLADLKKIHLVKKIHGDEDTKMKSLMLFSDASPPPRLEQLKFTVDKKIGTNTVEKQKQLAVIFNKLLASSKDTLEDLCLSGLISCSDLQFPVLEKLESLDLEWTLIPAPTACFPFGINMTSTFPQLHVLDCGTLHCSNDQAWEFHFPPASYLGNIPSVETLCISDTTTELWMTRLHVLVPNFKTLVIWTEWGSQCKVVLPKIFQLWTHLESIEIRVFRVGTTCKKQEFNLDSAFTGISDEVCLSLLHSLDAYDDYLQPQPAPVSLCHLKALKCLWITFNFCPHGDLVKVMQNCLPTVSHVSAIWAFNQMSNLKVAIFYDQNCPHSEVMKKTFESIAPYINFAHKHEYINNRVSHGRSK